MKTMKVALLATAALAAVSASARADDAAAIKAQLEALTARIAHLEAAPAAPVGYSLLTMSEATATKVPGLDGFSKQDNSYGDTASVIGILPTADAPATASVEWSGYVRAMIIYHDFNNDDSDGFTYSTDVGDGVDVAGRGQLKVVGKTDTAVGEVGVRLQLRGDFAGVEQRATVKYNEAWGWWAMTPELTLGGGYSGSLGYVGYGIDAACTCNATDWGDTYNNPGDTSQVRLSYASGPLTAAIALEDATRSSSNSPKYFNSASGDALGIAGKIGWAGDSVSGEIAGAWRDGDSSNSILVPHGGHFDSGVDGESSSWVIGAGMGFALGDMANLSIAANVGQTNFNADVWNVSALVGMNLSDTVRAEVGGGYKSYSYNDVVDGVAVPPDRDIWNVLAGVYYEPVSQLTIGLEAEYFQTTQGHLVANDDYELDGTIFALVTNYRF